MTLRRRGAPPFPAAVSHRERPVVAPAERGVEPEPFPFEFFEHFRIRNPVSDKVARHLPAAHFRVDHDGFQTVALADAEFGRDDTRFAADAFPVEQALHLAAGEVDQDAVVGMDFFEEGLCQPSLPVPEHRLVVVPRQYGVPFQPVAADCVQWPEQPVEERRDVEVLLCVFEIPGGESLRGDMPEYDARVGQQRGEGLFAVELPVTPAVGRGDLPVGAQHAFQLFGAERRQLQGQLRGLAGVTRQGRSGDFGRIVFGHRFGAGKEYLHGCGSKLDVLPLCRLRKAGERDERRHRELGREQVWTVWAGLVHLFADTVTRIPGRVDTGCEPGCEPVGVFGGRSRMR